MPHSMRIQSFGFFVSVLSFVCFIFLQVVGFWKTKVLEKIFSGMLQWWRCCNLFPIPELIGKEVPSTREHHYRVCCHYGFEIDKVGQRKWMFLEWKHLHKCCLEWTSWSVEVGQREWLSLGWIYLFKCCLEWTSWSVEVGLREWLSLGWINLFLCCSEWTSWSIEMPKRMVVLGMNPLVHMLPRMNALKYWNGPERMVVLGGMKDSLTSCNEDNLKCWSGPKRVDVTNWFWSVRRWLSVPIMCLILETTS